jgi:hypothetical protein
VEISLNESIKNGATLFAEVEVSSKLILKND